MEEKSIIKKETENRIKDLLNNLESKLSNTVDNLCNTLTSAVPTDTGYKYIDIDSTYRNRNKYPLASDFVIQYTNSISTTPFNAIDPVTTAYPYENGVIGVSTTTVIKLPVTSSTIDNYYVNSYIEINGEYRLITSYTYINLVFPATNYTVIVDKPFSVIPVVGSVYKIRYSLPVTTGTLQAGSTQNVVIMDTTSSSVDNFYKGMFIAFTSGPNTGNIILITEYNGTTKKAVLNKGLSNIPGLDSYEIDPFSYDNYQPMRYSGTTALNQPVCYVIQLLQMTVPAELLDISNGGKLSVYPFIYVHFYNDNNAHSDITMYGNNPDAQRATFKLAIDRSCIVTATNARFVCFNSIVQSAPQSLKLCITDPIRVKVTLPDGEPISYIIKDTMSPLPPLWNLQISMLIAILRI